MFDRMMDFLGFQDEVEEVTEEWGEASVFDDSHKKGRQKVVSIHSNPTARVILNEPRSYDEAQAIADHLCNHRAVVVNLQRLRKDQALRVVDFLSGTVYAINGQIQKLGPEIFICTPENVEVEGAISEIFYSEER